MARPPGRPLEPVYRPSDTAGLDYARDLGDPGQYPYTRGIHETMYRGRVWTMRQRIRMLCSALAAGAVFLLQPLFW